MGGGGGEGERGEVLVKCSLAFKVGYLIKRGAYFETRRNYNILLLISKSENVISCHLLRQQLSNWLALFSNLISIQKRKQLSNWLALFSNLISIQKRKQNKTVIAGIYFKN